MSEQNINQSRRIFLQNSIVTAALFPFMYPGLTSAGNDNQDTPLKISIFSKHLQFLNYQDMAEAAAEMGFDGIDLTVRPNGHVLPARVTEDLPKAVEAMRKVGFTPLMLTTAVENANNPTDKQLLESAAKLGFKYYRMNWLKYQDGKTMPSTIEHFQQQVKELSLLNKKLGLTGCYQNHAGVSIGSSLWELWQLLKEADKQHMGIQYDIRHAVVEGGLSWQNGLRLIESQIKTLTVKDFYWQKENGKWVVQDTSIGEGMVDFKTYFKLLKQYRLNVPVSLHMEYPLGGAEHGATKLSCDKQIVFNAMKKDVQKVRDLWQQV